MLPAVSFASDNTAPAHPDILAAIAAANTGHARPYGADEHTARAVEILRGHFGPQAEPLFVLLGTGANVLALRSLCNRYESVLCADCAHINNDEGGAPEAVGGLKLVASPSKNGIITPGDLAPHLFSKGFEHHAQPRAVSITQCTEYGVLYTPDQIRDIAAFCHANDLYLHMDGARLANACAALGVSLAEMTTDAGVDVVSLGGTKNGMMFGEAVVYLRPGLAKGARFHRKQVMQLASKMRYIAAQFTAMYGTGLWLDNAAHANAMAAALAREVAGAPGLTLTRPVDTNHVFARIPPEAVAPLTAEFPFYVWNDVTGEVRWMTSFDTKAEDVSRFAAAIRRELGRLAA